VKIKNTAKFKKIYDSSFLDYIQQKDGNFKTVKTKKGINFSSDYLEIFPKSMTLSPNEEGVFELTFKNKVTKTGEFLSYLAILEKEHEEETKATATGGIQIKGQIRIAIPVILRNGILSVGAEIKSAKLIEKNKQAMLKIKINRDGNKSIRGNLEILDGENKIGMLNEFSIYTHIDSMEYSIPLSLNGKKLLKSDVKGKQLQINFTANPNDEILLETSKQVQF